MDRDYHSPLYEDALLPVSAAHQPPPAIKAGYKLKNFESRFLLHKNMVFTDYLQNGVLVRFFENSQEQNELVYLVDYTDPDNNDFTVANQ